MKNFVCELCGYVYRPEKGDEENGIEAVPAMSLSTSTVTETENGFLVTISSDYAEPKTVEIITVEKGEYQDNQSAPIVGWKNINTYYPEIGNKVYVKSLDAFCKIVSVNAKKKEVEVSLGNIKSIVKFNDLFNSEKDCTTQKINVTRKTSIIDFKNELNVVGKTSLEAIEEVEFFLDRAVIAGVEEIKIIHGVATGTLLKTIREMLKKDKRVKQFRRGIYGEGENGVTIVTLK